MEGIVAQGYCARETWTRYCMGLFDGRRCNLVICECFSVLESSWIANVDPNMNIDYSYVGYTRIDSS